MVLLRFHQEAWRGCRKSATDVARADFRFVRSKEMNELISKQRMRAAGEADPGRTVGEAAASRSAGEPAILSRASWYGVLA